MSLFTDPLFSEDAPPKVLPTGERWEVLLWADAVHEHHEASLLSFWRLSFASEYDREAIFTKLQTFYDDFEITAHVAYETLGDYDLLLRLWMPRKFIPEELANSLRSLLRPNSLWDVNYMVGHTRVHRGRELSADRSATPSTPPAVHDEVIATVNEFNAVQVSGSPVVRPHEADALIVDDVLIPVPLYTRGIRFFTIFGPPPRPLTPAQTEGALAEIKARCQQVFRDWRPPPRRETEPDLDDSGHQYSIYSGDGTMTQFLLLGRAPHGYFHDFIRKLVLGLRQSSVVTVYQMRPYTYVIADRMFAEFTEHRFSAQDLTLTRAELETATETESLEFKATFGLDLRRLRAEGTPTKSPKVADQVIKAVCGLLNSRDGGRLVLGVLETEREIARARQGTTYLEWLQETFGYAPRRDEKTGILVNAVIGVQAEYTDGPYEDPDAYQNAIHQVLKDNISPDPWPWLRMAALTVDGADLVIISVRPGDTWHYARMSEARDQQFFVREASATRAYSGYDADLYKQANRRRTDASAFTTFRRT